MSRVATVTPSRTVVTSFTPRRPSLTPCSSFDSNGGGSNQSCYNAFEEGDWVLCMAAPDCTTSPSTTVACALSNGEVQVYDQERLHLIASYPHAHHGGTGGQNVVNDLVYGPQHSLITTGRDGSVAVFDLRQSQEKACSLRATLPSRQAGLSLSLGFDGYLVAVGSTKGRIHFLDLRGGTSNNSNNNNNRSSSMNGSRGGDYAQEEEGFVVGSYVDSHTDAVTQVHFRPGSGILLTGAEDGLACCFDTTQPTEERALKSILNVGTALRHVGFCGGTSTAYCLTGSETVSLWNCEDSTCLQDFGFGLREALSRSLQLDQLQQGQQQQQQQQPHGLTLSSSSDESLTTMDYLVDAYWDKTRQELQLLAGNAHGSAALFRLTADRPNEFQPTAVLSGGHRGVIRAWKQLSASTILTAGEDARLCEWQSGAVNGNRGMTTTGISVSNKRDASAIAAAASGGPLRRQRPKHSTSPY